MSNNEQLREKCPLCDGKVNIVPGTKNKEVMQGQCERCHVSADVEWFRAGGKTEPLRRQRLSVAISLAALSLSKPMTGK